MTDQRSRQNSAKSTIALVPYADASSWNGVIDRLPQQG
jgi:hypothetical protein